MVRYAIVGVLVAVFGAIGAARGLTALAEQRQEAQAQPVAAAAQVAPAPVAEPMDPGEASIAKSRDGHFWADAQVDGHQLHFLIDTGATAVALTSDDARQLGIDPSSLTYSYTVQTANGPAKAAAVKLHDVAVGRAEVPDVDAYVIDHGLETSLLGMSYLGRLSKFEATPDALVLRS